MCSIRLHVVCHCRDVCLARKQDACITSHVRNVRNSNSFACTDTCVATAQSSLSYVANSSASVPSCAQAVVGRHKGFGAGILPSDIRCGWVYSPYGKPIVDTQRCQSLLYWFLPHPYLSMTSSARSCGVDEADHIPLQESLASSSCFASTLQNSAARFASAVGKPLMQRHGMMPSAALMSDLISLVSGSL